MIASAPNFSDVNKSFGQAIICARVYEFDWPARTDVCLNREIQRLVGVNFVEKSAKKNSVRDYDRRRYAIVDTSMNVGFVKPTDVN